MLNGRRVSVRHLEPAPNAINDEASKKLVSIVYYENHNYTSERALGNMLCFNMIQKYFKNKRKKKGIYGN